MDGFLDRFHLSKLNQDQGKYLNNSIIPKEIEAVIKSLPSQTKEGSRAHPVPPLSIPKSCQERAGLPGVLTHLWTQVRPPVLLKFLVQEGPTQNHQDRGTKEWWRTGSFWFLSAPLIWPCATVLHTQILPGENWSPRSTDTQTCSWDRQQSKTASPANTTDYQMSIGPPCFISTVS